jgi:hypothetical protein
VLDERDRFLGAASQLEVPADDLAVQQSIRGTRAGSLESSAPRSAVDRGSLPTTDRG